MKDGSGELTHFQGSGGNVIKKYMSHSNFSSPHQFEFICVDICAILIWWCSVQQKRLGNTRETKR